jgi:hypothetical protein
MKDLQNQVRERWPNCKKVNPYWRAGSTYVPYLLCSGPVKELASGCLDH